MIISLSESQEQFVRSLMQGGRYASEAKVIDEALRLLERRDLRQAAEKQRVESLLLEGLGTGPSTPMSPSDCDDIEREGQRLIAARQVRNGR